MNGHSWMLVRGLIKYEGTEGAAPIDTIDTVECRGKAKGDATERQSSFALNSYKPSASPAPPRRGEKRDEVAEKVAESIARNVRENGIIFP